MRSAYRKALNTLLGVALTLALSGCTGILKMPINEYSHIDVEASPFGNKFQLSYHLYDKLPPHAYSEDWTGKFKLKQLGTVYDSEKEVSPLVTRIDRAWQKVRRIGPINWATVERLIVESNAEPEEETRSKPSKTRSKSKSKSLEPWQRADLPIAEMPLFLFSSPPRW